MSLPKTMAFAGVILSLTVIYCAASSAYSQLLSYPARHVLKIPFVAGVDNSQREDYEEALVNIEAASVSARINSHFWQMTGDILMRLGRADAAMRQDYYARGTAAFRRGIEADPTNAILWSRLLAAKTAQHDYGDEYATVYAKAFEYGQRDYRVVKTLSRLGFMAWSEMPISSRLIQKKAVRALYEKSPMDVVAIAREHNHVYMACLWVSDLALVDGYCIHELKKVP